MAQEDQIFEQRRVTGLHSCERCRLEMESSSIEIKLKRMDRVYKPKETVYGVIVVNAYKGWSHSGVTMLVEGLIHMNHAGRNMIGLGSDISSRPIHILKFEKDVCTAGKFADGVTEIPFEFVVTPVSGQTLLESYHGVYISVIYNIQVNCERGMMKKSLHRDLEFIIEIPTPVATVDPLPVPFNVTPESLENLNASVVATIPKFKISGKLSSI